MGGFLFLALIAVAAWLWRRRHKRRERIDIDLNDADRESIGIANSVSGDSRHPGFPLTRECSWFRGGLPMEIQIQRFPEAI